MSLSRIERKAREVMTAVDIDWRTYVPQEAQQYLDRATILFERQYAEHRTQLDRLDQHFSTIAKILLLAWIIDRWLAPGWRNLWAKGLTGSVIAIYAFIRDVCVPTTLVSHCG